MTSLLGRKIKTSGLRSVTQGLQGPLVCHCFCCRKKYVHVVHAQPVLDEPNLLGPAANSGSGHGVCPETVIDATNIPETSESSVKNAIKKAFQAIKDAKDPIDTLILVYSGHHGDSGFQLLGNEQDVMPDNELCEQIQELNNVKKVIAFFDCYGKSFAMCGLGEHKKVVQFCSSNRKCETFGTERLENSLFTKFLIQAFTRKANDARCLNAGEQQKKECEDCKELDLDTITFEKLTNYLEKHMKVYSACHERPCYSSFNATSIQGQDLVIGYTMPFDASVSFKLKTNGGLQDERVTMKDLKDSMTMLKRHFLQKLLERKSESVCIIIKRHASY